jgi:hypothetical protein
MIRGGALAGPGGVISAENVVVRSAEGGFGANKMLYELGRTWNMPAWSRELFWVTVKIPPKSKPGTYRGRVTVTSAGKPIGEILVSLEVLPIELDSDKAAKIGSLNILRNAVADHIVRLQRVLN